MNKAAKAISFILTLSMLITMNVTSVFAYEVVEDPISNKDKNIEVYINGTEDSGYTQNDLNLIKSKLEATLNSAKKSVTSGGINNLDTTTYRVLASSDYAVRTNISSIDVTDTSDWYVYDHYDTSATLYPNTSTGWDKWKNEYKCSTTTEAIRPYQANTNTQGTLPTTIANQINDGSIYASQNVFPIPEHIYSYTDSSNLPAMTFMGYYSGNYRDFLFYPAQSSGTKTVEYDVDARHVMTHSLRETGFLFNTGIDASGVIHGYALSYTYLAANGVSSPVTGIQSVSVKKIADGTTALNFAANSAAYLEPLATPITTTGAVFSEGGVYNVLSHINLQISPTGIVVQQKNASSAGIGYTTIIDTSSLPDSGYNGFGPYVGYSGVGHSCFTTSSFKFTNLQMAFEQTKTASVLSAIKQAAFKQDSEKYFVNLTTPTEQAVELSPDDWSEIAKLRQQEIRYITNQNNPFLTDGRINTNGDAPNGNFGKTLQNTATIDELVAEMAAYILGYNVWDETKLPQVQVAKPIAIFTPYAQVETSPGGVGNIGEYRVVDTIAKNFISSTNGTKVHISADAKNVAIPSGQAFSYLTYKFKDSSGKVLNTVVMNDESQLRTTKAALYTVDYSTTPDAYEIELILTTSGGRVEINSVPYLVDMAVNLDTLMPAVTMVAPNSTTITPDAWEKRTVDVDGNSVFTSGTATQAQFAGDYIEMNMEDSGEGIIAYDYGFQLTGTDAILSSGYDAYGVGKPIYRTTTPTQVTLNSPVATLDIAKMDLPNGQYIFCFKTWDKVGNYTEVKRAVKNNSIKADMVTLPTHDFVYTLDSSNNPIAHMFAANGIVVTFPGPKVLEMTTDYAIGTYANNTQAGIGTLLIEGKGAYTGSLNVPFTIAQRPVTFVVSNNIVIGNDKNQMATVEQLSSEVNKIATNKYTVLYKQGSTIVASPTAVGIYDIYVTINDANYTHAISNGNATANVGTLSINNKGGGNANVSVIVDGITSNIGKIIENVTGQGKENTISVDKAALDKRVAEAKEGSAVIVPVSVNGYVASTTVKFYADSVKKMADKELDLVMQSGEFGYAIPANAIDLSIIDEATKAGGKLNAIEMQFTVARLSEEKIKTLKAAAVKGNYEMLAEPLEFSVKAVYGGRTQVVSVFTFYTTKEMKISKEVAEKATTAVVFKDDGTILHAPTKIVTRNGEYFAVISTFTNSKYGLINNSMMFNDLKDKMGKNSWYEEAVTEMANRKVISGYSDGSFKGGNSILRADFVGIVMRGLGLPTITTKTNADGTPAATQKVFSDVNSSAWYAGSVAAAVELGIVTGAENNQFKPNNKITREEAMAIIERAAKVAGMAAPAQGTVGMAIYTDKDQLSKWAVEPARFNLLNGLVQGYNGKLQPKADITRAETSVIVLRLMEKLGIV